MQPMKTNPMRIPMEETVKIEDFVSIEAMDSAWFKMNKDLTAKEREEVNKWRMLVYILVDTARRAVEQLYEHEGTYQSIGRQSVDDDVTLQYKRARKSLDRLYKEIGDIPMFTE